MELFETVTLGKHTLKNRIFRSATNEHLAAADGGITEELIHCYEELAEGGVGTIITGHYCIVPDARTSLDQASIPGSDVEVLRKAAERVHRHGAKLIMQLSHGGLKAPREINGREPVGPSNLTAEDMEEFRRLFVTGAKIAREAGFDGVQVHGAHGYLLSNFLDPFENTRVDEYGGTVENRFRYLGEIVRDIREACSQDFLILVKLNADASEACEYVPDLHRILELCQEAGVDAAEISGLAFSKKKANVDEPYFLQEVQEAMKGIRMPVILVGGLDSREKMQQALDAGIPYVSLSRSLICQPDFVNRMKEGAEKSPCLRCFGCFRVFKNRYVRCVLHQEPIPRIRQMYGKE